VFFRVGAGRCAAANRAHSAAQPGRGNGPEAMRLVKRTNALADAKSYEQATPLYSRRWTCGGNVRKWWEGARTTVELLSLEGSHVRGDVDPHGKQQRLGHIRGQWRRGCIRSTVRLRELEIMIGTSISEASKRVPIFPFATQGGKHTSSYFRQSTEELGPRALLFAAGIIFGLVKLRCCRLFLVL